MVVKVSGSLREVVPQQSRNALSPMAVTPEGTTMAWTKVFGPSTPVTFFFQKENFSRTSIVFVVTACAKKDACYVCV